MDFSNEDIVWVSLGSILDKVQKGILREYAMYNAIIFFLSLIKIRCMKKFLSQTE